MTTNDIIVYDQVADPSEFVKLDALAQAFGVLRKLDTGGMSGAEFSRFYWGSAEERQLALLYLVRDVEITTAVAGKMGVI